MESDVINAIISGYMCIIKSLYVSSSIPPRPPRPRPPPSKLFTHTSKPFGLNLWYLAQRIYGSGEMYWMTFPWPWPKVAAVASISKNLLVGTVKWESLIGSLQNMTALFLMTRLDFGEIMLKTVILANFGCVFSRSNTILAIFQDWLVRLLWNEKEVHWFDTGYNIWPWPLTSLMTLTLDVSRSNFKIALSPEFLVWLMWNEKEVSLYDTGPIVWPCPLTTPMTLTLEFHVQSLK